MIKKINLDFARLIASFLVVAIHISPFAMINNDLDFVFSRVIARFAVPLFLTITGYFLLPKALEDKEKLKEYLKKIIKIYLFCIIIYIPLNIYKKDFNGLNILAFLKTIFIEGTIYHLWYFPALILGILITYYSLKKFNIKNCFFIFFFLYLIGLLGDSYYGLSIKSDILLSFYDFIFSITDYTRCGLFYVPIFLYLGFYISKKKDVNTKTDIVFFFISLLLMITEALILYKLEFIRHDSMYLMLVPAMYFLFSALKNNNQQNRKLRDISTSIYIFHPYFIVFVRMFSKLLNLERVLVFNNLIHYIIVIITTFIFAFILEFIKEKVKR